MTKKKVLNKLKKVLNCNRYHYISHLTIKRFYSTDKSVQIKSFDVKQIDVRVVRCWVGKVITTQIIKHFVI